MRWPQARYSTDVDLLRTGADVTVRSAVEALIAATSGDLDDHLQFSHYDTSGETAAGRPTRKVRFRVMFGLKQLAMVSVDVVATNLRPKGKLVIEQLDAPFTIDSSPWPQIRIWPIEDHVADKIAAMYELHRGSLPSTRFKDLVELVLIARNSMLGGELTHTALHAEVRRRNDAGGKVILPPEFAVPDPTTWAAGYRAQAVKTHELPADYRTLKGATPLAAAFVSPLLDERPPSGTWTFDRLRWE